MIGNFPAVLKLHPVISQTHPVRLQLTAGSPRSLGLTSISQHITDGTRWKRRCERGILTPNKLTASSCVNYNIWCTIQICKLCMSTDTSNGNQRPPNPNPWLLRHSGQARPSRLIHPDNRQGMWSHMYRVRRFRECSRNSPQHKLLPDLQTAWISQVPSETTHNMDKRTCLMSPNFADYRNTSSEIHQNCTSVGRDPSVSETNRLHVDIFRFIFLKLKSSCEIVNRSVIP